MEAVNASNGRFVVLIDTLRTPLCERADVLIPSATWAEKAGVFENANNRLQAFERAIEPIDFTKSEAQIALDLTALAAGDESPGVFNAAQVRRSMADAHGMSEFVEKIHYPAAEHEAESDMQLVEL
jgi:anaerobic selenocysteine-containing dehydrogenase